MNTTRPAAVSAAPQAATPRQHRRRHPRRWPGDRGSVSLLALVGSFGMLLAIALLVDGARQSAATSQATAIAEEAARAGAQAADPAALATGSAVVVDPQRAIIEATTYLTTAGATAGSVQIQGNQLTVQVEITRPTIFLSMIGITQLTASGAGSAVLLSTG